MQLDWLVCAFFGLVCIVGGSIGMATKRSVVSLAAGVVSGALYFTAAYLILFPPNISRRMGASKHSEHAKAIARTRRRANRLAGAVGLVLFAVFFARWYFGEANNSQMAFGMMGFGVLSFVLNGVIFAR